MKRKKLPSLASLKRKADRVFSAWIRRRDALPDGTGRCISCGIITKLQAGHWIKRGHLALRYDPRNVHGQCVRCNHFLGGNEGAYAAALVRKYGVGAIEDMLSRKHNVTKLSRDDYLSIIERYK